MLNQVGVTSHIVVCSVISLSVLRFIGLWVSMKGEMSMNIKRTRMVLFVASAIETIWAMMVSCAVGTWLSPIVHKLTRTMAENFNKDFHLQK